MLVIWQSFSDCFSVFLFCELWGPLETSTIKQGSRSFKTLQVFFPNVRTQASSRAITPSLSKAKAAVVSG